jgi:hypothetical protein
VKAAGSQLDSKARGIYLMRGSRHHGLASGIDSHKQTSVDTDFRALCDFIFFKSTGIGSLPDDLKFAYRFLKPAMAAQHGALRVRHPFGERAIGCGVNAFTP